MNKLAEKVLDIAARLVVGVIDRIDRRREKRELPTLDPRLETLSIEDAVAKARAEREAKNRAH